MPDVPLPDRPRRSAADRFAEWAAGLPDYVRDQIDSPVSPAPPDPAAEFAAWAGDTETALPDVRDDDDNDTGGPYWFVACQEGDEGWLTLKACPSFAAAAEWFRRRLGHDTTAFLVHGHQVPLTRATRGRPPALIDLRDHTGYRLGADAVEFVPDVDAAGLAAEVQDNGYLGPPPLEEVLVGPDDSTAGPDADGPAAAGGHGDDPDEDDPFDQAVA